MSLLHSHLLTLLVRERGSVAPCYWEAIHEYEGGGERERGEEREKEREREVEGERDYLL